MALLSARKTSVAVSASGRASVITIQDSQVVTRNLVRLGISSIAYLRALFPSECFRDRDIQGTRFKTLARSSMSEEFLQMIEDGVLGAMKMEVVHAILFDIHSGEEVDESNDESTLLERYQFQITRADEAQQGRDQNASKPTKAEVQKQIAMMIRQMTMVTGLLKPLPDTKTIVIKIVFNLGCEMPSTPIPHFSLGDDFFNEEFCSTVSAQPLGSIETGHHTIQVKLQPVSKEAPLQTASTTAQPHYESPRASSGAPHPSARQDQQEQCSIPDGVYEALKPLRYVTPRVLIDRLGFEKKKSEEILQLLEREGIVGPKRRNGNEILVSVTELERLTETGTHVRRSVSTSAHHDADVDEMAQVRVAKRTRVRAPSPATSIRITEENRAPPVRARLH